MYPVDLWLSQMVEQLDGMVAWFFSLNHFLFHQMFRTVMYPTVYSGCICERLFPSFEPNENLNYNLFSIWLKDKWWVRLRHPFYFIPLNNNRLFGFPCPFNLFVCLYSTSYCGWYSVIDNCLSRKWHHIDVWNVLGSFSDNDFDSMQTTFECFIVWFRLRIIIQNTVNTKKRRENSLKAETKIPIITLCIFTDSFECV